MSVQKWVIVQSSRARIVAGLSPVRLSGSILNLAP